MDEKSARTWLLNNDEWNDYKDDFIKLIHILKNVLFYLGLNAILVPLF